MLPQIGSFNILGVLTTQSSVPGQTPGRKGQKGTDDAISKGQQETISKIMAFFFLNEFYLHNYCRSSFWQKELLGAKCWNFAPWDKQQGSDWLCRRGQEGWWQLPALKDKTLH